MASVAPLDETSAPDLAAAARELGSTNAVPNIRQLVTTIRGAMMGWYSLIGAAPQSPPRPSSQFSPRASAACQS